MQITEVSLRKYRAFDREVRFALSPFTVLTGPNNLGKSTVLRALEVFFNAVGRGRLVRVFQSRVYNAEDDYPKGYKRGRKWPTVIELQFALTPADVQSRCSRRTPR